MPELKTVPVNLGLMVQLMPCGLAQRDEFEQEVAEGKAVTVYLGLKVQLMPCGLLAQRDEFEWEVPERGV